MLYRLTKYCSQYFSALLLFKQKSPYPPTAQKIHCLSSLLFLHKHQTVSNTVFKTTPRSWSWSTICNFWTILRSWSWSTSAVPVSLSLWARTTLLKLECLERCTTQRWTKFCPKCGSKDVKRFWSTDAPSTSATTWQTPWPRTGWTGLLRVRSWCSRLSRTWGTSTRTSCMRSAGFRPLFKTLLYKSTFTWKSLLRSALQDGVRYWAMGSWWQDQRRCFWGENHNENFEKQWTSFNAV